MSVGEVISLLVKYASSFEGDELLMVKELDKIEVFEDHIDIYFTDYNTLNYSLTKDGKKLK